MRRLTAVVAVMALWLAAGVAAGREEPASTRRLIVLRVPGGGDDGVVRLAEALMKEGAPSDEGLAGGRPFLQREVRMEKGEARLWLTVYATGAAALATPEAKVSLDRLADAHVEALAASVGPVWERLVGERRGEAEKWKSNVEQAKGKLETAREELKKAETRMQESTGRIDLSVEGMRAAKDALEIERQKVELDLAGLAARRAALEEAVAEQAVKAKVAAESDLAVVAVKKAVEAAQANVKRSRALFEAGALSTSEMSQAELQAMEVEARLAERMNSAGGAAEAMAGWNRELTNAAIEQREKEAMLKAATTRLGMLVEAGRAGSELRRLQEQVEGLEMSVKGGEERLRAASEWLKEYGGAKPVVEVRE